MVFQSTKVFQILLQTALQQHMMSTLTLFKFQTFKSMKWAHWPGLTSALHLTNNCRCLPESLKTAGTAHPRSFLAHTRTPLCNISPVFTAHPYLHSKMKIIMCRFQKLEDFMKLSKLNGLIKQPLQHLTTRISHSQSCIKFNIFRKDNFLRTSHTMSKMSPVQTVLHRTANI